MKSAMQEVIAKYAGKKNTRKASGGLTVVAIKTYIVEKEIEVPEGLDPYSRDRGIRDEFSDWAGEVTADIKPNVRDMQWSSSEIQDEDGEELFTTG